MADEIVLVQHAFPHVADNHDLVRRRRLPLEPRVGIAEAVGQADGWCEHRARKARLPLVLQQALESTAAGHHHEAARHPRAPLRLAARRTRTPVRRAPRPQPRGAAGAPPAAASPAATAGEAPPLASHGESEATGTRRGVALPRQQVDEDRQRRASSPHHAAGVSQNTFIELDRLIHDRVHRCHRVESEPLMLSQVHPRIARISRT